MLVHGLGDTLESYTEHARVLNRRGHTVLLVDLRAHGGSEGQDSTLGGRERADVRAAAQHLRTRGLAPAGLVFMGFSLGTAAVMGAAPDEPDVRAVVLEAPFDSARGTIAHHGWLLYRMPGWLPLGRLALAIAGWRAGFDPDESTWCAAAARLRAPLLTIVDGDDPRMPEAVVRRVYEAHPGPKGSGWRPARPRGRHPAPGLLGARHGVPGRERSLAPRAASDDREARLDVDGHRRQAVEDLLHRRADDGARGDQLLGLRRVALRLDGHGSRA